MARNPRQPHNAAVLAGILRDLDDRFRLLLRRSGLHTRLREHERILDLASAKLRLDIAQAVTPLGTPVYPTDAARCAAFTLAAENDLALHAVLAVIEHLRRRLDVTEAELTAVRAERVDLRLQFRAVKRPRRSPSSAAPASGAPQGLPPLSDEGDPTR